MRLSRSVLKQAGLIVLSPMVLTEADHLLRRIGGPGVREAFLDGIVDEAKAGRIRLPEVTADMVAAARGVMRRYAPLDLDLADAVNVVLAAEYRTDAVLTFARRDFRSVRPLTAHKAFQVLPDDL